MQLKKRIRYTGNGVMVTDLTTLKDEVHYNTGKVTSEIRDFINDAISGAEEGEYYDIVITTQKQRLPKPNAATSAPKAKVVVKAKRKK